MPDVTAALVTYNRKDLLKEAIEALLNSSYPVHILVADNASTDGTAQMLQPYIDAGQIEYWNTGSNLGGAGGFAFAMKKALGSQPDYIWLMDDDTIVHPDSLERLMEQARKHPDAGFFSSKALWVDGSENKMNAHRLMKHPQSSPEALACREATFVSLLVPTPMVYEKGLPIAEFFIWGDDIEYTRRISADHYGLYVPGSVVLHKTKNNEGSDIARDALERLPRYRYAYRNEVYMANAEGWKRQARQLAKILYHSAKAVLLSKEARTQKVALIWSASKEGMHFHPQIEYPLKKRGEQK